jgi:hypothetical protein
VQQRRMNNFLGMWNEVARNLMSKIFASKESVVGANTYVIQPVRFFRSELSIFVSMCQIRDSAFLIPTCNILGVYRAYARVYLSKSRNRNGR